MYAAKAARLLSARSWLRHSHASLRHSLATLQTCGLLIRVAKPSYTTGTLCASFLKLKNMKKYTVIAICLFLFLNACSPKNQYNYAVHLSENEMILLKNYMKTKNYMEIIRIY
jgi:hypothetical protein